MILNDSPDITVFELNGVKFLVVDNFFSNPDAVRAYGIGLAGLIDPKEVSVGYELHPDRDDFIHNFGNLPPVLGQMIHSHIGENVRSDFGLGDKNPRLRIRKGPLFNCVYKMPYFPPHVDPRHISSFTYLNTPDQYVGGTGVYCHKPTNKMTVVQEGVDLEWMTTIPLTERLMYSTEEWELVHVFEMQYNRLIAFNSSVIHKILIPPGPIPFEPAAEKARLTFNCFFHYCPENRF